MHPWVAFHLNSTGSEVRYLNAPHPSEPRDKKRKATGIDGTESPGLSNPPNSSLRSRRVYTGKLRTNRQALLGCTGLFLYVLT